MQLLHIIQDEKFPDSAQELFEEAAPGCNTFVLPETEKDIIYLKKITPKRISRFSYLNPIFLSSLKNYTAVFLHSLTQFSVELVSRADSKVNFVWIGMGYDYYDILFDDPFEKLEEKTAQLVKNCIPRYGLKEPENPLKRIAKNILYPNLFKKASSVNNINYFCPVENSEFNLISKKIPNFTPKFLDWNYGVTAKFLSILPLPKPDPEFRILLGNSASPNNNHIEAFEIIKNAGIPENAKIIVPLSYGPEGYRDELLNIGYSILGDHFTPITEFLPVDEYLNLIATCSVTIMNHHRQQAGNNIAASLALGSRLFINKKNTFYNEYTKHGAFVDDVDNLRCTPDLLKSPLTLEEKKKNKEIVCQLRSWETVLGKTQRVISIVSGLNLPPTQQTRL